RQGTTESNKETFADKKDKPTPAKEKQNSSMDKPKTEATMMPEQKSSNNQTDSAKTEAVSDKVKP
ncbi:MAG: hypothetical protein L3J59_10930, partial [Methylococcaceae bacterium]|nr:hypothetical protein [Methylococcaceae bacterium]